MANVANAPPGVRPTLKFLSPVCLRSATRPVLRSYMREVHSRWGLRSSIHRCLEDPIYRLETLNRTRSGFPGIESGAADSPALPVDVLLAAAKNVLGPRPIEAIVNDVGVVELYLVVHAVTS